MSATLQRHYKLHPSQYLATSIFIACLLAQGVLFLLPLGMIAYSVLSLFILVACAFIFFRDARLSFANSCVAFRLEAEDNISLILRDGRHQSGKLAAGSIILPFVVLINIRIEQRVSRGLVLFGDSTDADSFRRLRVFLRWGVKRQGPVSSA